MGDSGSTMALIAAGRAMLERGLAWGTSGNLSARLDAAHLLVSATGTALGALAPESFVRVRLADGGWDGALRPSKELPMHLGIHRVRPDAAVVLHASPHYTTLLACTEEPIPSGLFVESMYYLERIAWVDYAHPGSVELGAKVAQAAAGAEVIMMRNHGVIVFDRTAEEAVLRLQTLEMTCRMLVEARAAGLALQALPPPTVRDFLEGGRYKPRPIRPTPSQS